MAKNKSLAGAMSHLDKRHSEPPAPISEDEPKGKGTIPKSRKGKRVIAGFFDKAASRQMNLIAIEEDTSVQKLLQEAVNDFFEKRGKARIA